MYTALSGFNELWVLYNVWFSIAETLIQFSKSLFQLSEEICNSNLLKSKASTFEQKYYCSSKFRSNKRHITFEIQKLLSFNALSLVIKRNGNYFYTNYVSTGCSRDHGKRRGMLHLEFEDLMKVNCNELMSNTIMFY